MPSSYTTSRFSPSTFSPGAIGAFAAASAAACSATAMPRVACSIGAARLNAASDLDLIVIYDAGGVEASDGRVVAYTYDPLGRLVAVHGGPRGERRYDWDDAAGLLCRVTDADGIVEVDNTYDVRGRVSTQRSVFGR